MSNTDPLVLLIKAMTKSEKRYFKVDMCHSKSNIVKDYLRLFDAIDAQKVYDEKAIIRKFKGEPYFKRLKNVKSYLHRQILKSLRNFYAGTSINMNLNNYLSEIEILYKKKLLKNCVNTIQRAKAYAEKYEKLSYLQKIIEWEIKIADYTNGPREADALKQKVIGEAKEIAGKQSENLEADQIYFQLKSAINATGRFRTSEAAAFMDNILNHPLMSKELKSFYGKMVMATMKVMYDQVKGNLAAADMRIENIIQLYDAHPHQITENINRYFLNVLILAGSQLRAKKYTKAEELLKKAKNIYQLQPGGLTALNQMRLLYSETGLVFDKGEFVKAMHMVPKMNSLLESAREDMGFNEELLFYSMASNIYFLNKEIKKAQYYIQKIINYNPDVRVDVQSSARIVNLILQYEQQEYEHLGYILRSTYRYLMKKQRLLQPEKIIIDFLRKALKFSSEKQITEALAECKQQILLFIEDPFMFDFPLIEWIDSKLQKRELSEIIRENYLEAVAKEGVEAIN